MNFDVEIKTQLITLATIAGKELNQTALQAYCEALSDLPKGQVLLALKNWLRTESGFPFPAQIREKLKPEINLKDDAEDVANIIIAQVGHCGYTNAGRAKEKIGELGWEVITRMGGWKHLCETLNLQNETQFRAQIRNYTETVAKKSIRGELHQTTELPQSAKVYEITSNAFKQIEKV